MSGIAHILFCNSPLEKRSPAGRASSSQAINIPGALEPGLTPERGLLTECEYVGAAQLEVGQLLYQGQLFADDNGMWEKLLKTE